MKLFVLASFSLGLHALQHFKNSDELTKCIMDCEENITPCIQDEDKVCFKTYRKCINEEDPFNCLSSSNSLEVSKIVQCFDTKCTEL